MKKIIIAITLIGIIALVGFLSVPFKTSKIIDEVDREVKEFDMVAKSWEFIPSTIEVNKGDKVILNIRSIDVTHGIAISEFDVRENLSPGKLVQIEFIADKRGEFSFFCNMYCGEGHGNMNGRLIVN